MNRPSQEAQPSLISVLAQHTVRLFALSHRGEGLHISNHWYLSVVLMLPTALGLAIGGTATEGMFRGLLMIVTLVAQTRSKAVGVAIIYLTQDVVVLLNSLVGIPYLELVTGTWGMVAIIVFFFSTPRVSAT